MKSEVSTMSIFKKMLEGGIPMAANMMLGWVDVLDVSEAHIKCLTDSSVESGAYILSED
jgi:hypothetical protein